MPRVKVYQRFCPRLNLKYCFRYFAQSLPHFTRGEKSEIWCRFSTANHLLVYPRLTMEHHIWNIIRNPGMPTTGLRFPHIWCKSVARLWENGSTNLFPEKKRVAKFVKSLITQPHIARYCWNLVGWCITDLVIRAVGRRPRVAMQR